MMLLTIAIALLSAYAVPSRSSAAVGSNIVVKFDHQFYRITYDNQNFVYKDATREQVVKTKPCNRKLVSRLKIKFDGLIKQSRMPVHRSKTKYDVEVTINGRSSSIARGSPLGRWLRRMPQRTLFLNAETRVACK